jgi:hypothetical protein
MTGRTYAEPEEGNEMQQTTEPATLWLRWMIGSALTLASAAAAVFWGGLNSALLLGWAVGMVFAAILILFRRAH